MDSHHLQIHTWKYKIHNFPGRWRSWWWWWAMGSRFWHGHWWTVFCFIIHLLLIMNYHMINMSSACYLVKQWACPKQSETRNGWTSAQWSGMCSSVSFWNNRLKCRNLILIESLIFVNMWYMLLETVYKSVSLCHIFRHYLELNLLLIYPTSVIACQHISSTPRLQHMLIHCSTEKLTIIPQKFVLPHCCNRYYQNLIDF